MGDKTQLPSKSGMTPDDIVQVTGMNVCCQYEPTREKLLSQRPSTGAVDGDRPNPGNIPGIGGNISR